MNCDYDCDCWVSEEISPGNCSECELFQYKSLKNIVIEKPHYRHCIHCFHFDALKDTCEALHENHILGEWLQKHEMHLDNVFCGGHQHDYRELDVMYFCKNKHYIRHKYTGGCKDFKTRSV